MKRKTILLLTAFLSFSLIFAGCGPDGETGGNSAGASQSSAAVSSENSRTITNLDGGRITVPEKAERIAAVYGPTYEICAALGAEDRIVVDADVQFENFPWARKIFKRITKLPYLKNVHSTVSFEELQKYSPDIVLTFNRPNELSQLRKAGIAAVNGLTPDSLEQDRELVDVYAQALGGNAPERAEKYTAFFNERLDRIRSVTDSLDDSERPSVYYAGVDMLTTYGNRSDIPEAIEAAGGTPVMKDLNAGNHTAIDYEQLAGWNPDYIFIDHGGMNDRKTVDEIMKGTEKNAKYQSINAVKNGKMYLVPSGTFYWDMGIQKILLVEYMAKTLHPDLFADLDMKSELQSFYREFFGYELTGEEAQQILDRKDPS